MIRIASLTLALLISGCTLHGDYVKQDRANYETLAPVVSKMLTETKLYDEDFKEDIRDRLASWDAWTLAAIGSGAK